MKKLLSLLLLASLPCHALFAQTNANFTRTEDVIYGRKFGTALTMDVFQPANPNGFGVILLVSGGWISDRQMIKPAFYQPLLDHGYTVFAVLHGSQPKYTALEVELDIHRAVRFIRHNAAKFGINPDRLGLTGGSAGGHLSLTMATQGAAGSPDAKDPVERESSEVQCVACFFPPTDFLNYSKPGDDAVGTGALKEFKPAFGSQADTAEGRQLLGHVISPIYFVHSNMPPILIIHGDADKLVPIYQSKIFVKRCEDEGSPVKLIVRRGQGHGWSHMEKDMELFADWFDQKLRGKPVN